MAGYNKRVNQKVVTFQCAKHRSGLWGRIMSKECQNVVHTFEPVYNQESRVLILGSFPSVKSREAGFYYYHPQNRFWKVLSSLLCEPLPESIGEKKAMLLKHYIALWDVVASCDIVGSSDSSIKHAVPVDIGRVLSEARVEKIITNGATADNLYRKYLYPLTGMEAVRLPSTSPANAAFSLEKLCDIWREEIRQP